MCGIFGFTWPNKELLDKMARILRHRGPDYYGNYVDNNVSLGHVRLSIIDLSKDANQPMYSPNGNVVVIYNGEIFNFLELRKLLERRGHRFVTNSDTEVLVHAYLEWGFNAVRKFNGMWAFVLYDQAKKILWLSRDYFGIKPLYYSWSKSGLVFSSEIKALIKSELVQPVIDEEQVRNYLLLGKLDFNKKTLFKDIYQLRPGENLIYNLDTKKVETFYSYEIPSRDWGYGGNLLSLLRDSAEKRLLADVPIAFLLSGGLDSSLLLKLLSLEHKDLVTFSAVYGDWFSKDETKYINMIARDTGVDSIKIYPDVSRLEKEVWDLVYHQDQPFGSTSIFAAWSIYQAMKKRGYRVAINGQGADELFGGYFLAKGMIMRDYLLSGKVLKFLVSFLNILRTDKRDLVYFVQSMFPRFVYLRLRRRAYLKIPPVATVPSPKNTKDMLYLWTFSTTLQEILRYDDRNAMAFSIENRVPYLDPRLVNYAFNMPLSGKVTPLWTKYILRKIASELKVPQEIVWRKDKVGFETPEEHWFKTKGFITFAEEIFSDQLSKKYIDKNKYLRELEKAQKFLPVKDLWHPLNLEIWMKVFDVVTPRSS